MSRLEEEIEALQLCFDRYILTCMLSAKITSCIYVDKTQIQKLNWLLCNKQDVVQLFIWLGSSSLWYEYMYLLIKQQRIVNI